MEKKEKSYRKKTSPLNSSKQKQYGCQLLQYLIYRIDNVTVRASKDLS